MGSHMGYLACGMDEVWDQDHIFFSRNATALAGLDEAHALDGILFSGTPRSVERVEIAGKSIVEEGQHIDLAAIMADYESTIKKLDL